MKLTNPIVTKEFRGRMRRNRAFWLQAVFLIPLAITAFVAYAVYYVRAAGTDGWGTVLSAWSFGRTLFSILVIGQAILIALLTPAFTSGALTLEREQKTLDALLLTPITPRAAVVGKVASPVFLCAVLLSLTLPLASITFLLGGVSPGEVAAAYLCLLLFVIIVAALGIAWSAACARTVVSTPLSYLSVAVYMGATGLLAAAESAYEYQGVDSSFFLCALNPIAVPFWSSRSCRLYGHQVGVTTVAIGFSFLIAWLLVVLAVHHFAQLRNSTRGSWVRLPLALIVASGAAGTWEFVAQPVPSQGFRANQWCVTQGFVIMGMIVLLTLLAPLLATSGSPRDSAEGTPGRRRLSCLRFWEGRPESAFTYLLVLAAVIAVLGTCSTHRLGGPQDQKNWADRHSFKWVQKRTKELDAMKSLEEWRRQEQRLQSRPVFQKNVSVGQFRRVSRAVLLRLLAVALAALACYVSLSRFARSFTNNRWAAMGIAYALVVTFWLVPHLGFLSVAHKEGAVRDQVHGAGNLLYAAPLLSAVEIGDPGSFYQARGLRMALDGRVPFWHVTASIHLALAVAFWIAGVVIVWRKRRSGAERLGTA